MKNEVSDRFVDSTAETIKFEKDIPARLLKGCTFRHYGINDPSGLCDGGDYIDEVQIRIDDDHGSVYVSVRPNERGDWWYLKLSWEDFAKWFTNCVKKHKLSVKVD